MKIKVDLAEAYRYMGGRGEPDGQEKKELEKAAEMIAESSNPRSIERFFSVDRSGDGVLLSETELLLPGKAVRALLKDCRECMIFCVTIGNEPEMLIRRWEVENIAFAAALDACASSAVESLCEQEEKKAIGSEEVFLTDRFSPGYEDLPLSLQPDFCRLLDTGRKIGVMVSGSGVMIPRKSVTALVGIADRKQKSRDSGCSACPAYGSCSYRESGVTCYGHIL